MGPGEPPGKGWENVSMKPSRSRRPTWSPCGLKSTSTDGGTHPVAHGPSVQIGMGGQRTPWVGNNRGGDILAENNTVDFKSCHAVIKTDLTDSGCALGRGPCRRWVFCMFLIVHSAAQPSATSHCFITLCKARLPVRASAAPSAQASGNQASPPWLQRTPRAVGPTATSTLLSQGKMTLVPEAGTSGVCKPWLRSSTGPFGFVNKVLLAHNHTQSILQGKGAGSQVGRGEDKHY